MPFDPQRDLTAVAPIAFTPSVITIHPSVPAKTLTEFIAYGRAHPNAINYGSAGQGSTTHLSAAQLAQMAGIEMVHIPYKGAAPAIVDLVAGNVQMVSGPPPNVMAFLREGRLRALAIASKTRSQLLPEVPTTAEAGLPGYEPSTWYAIVAPAGLPKAITERLHAVTRGFVDSAAGRKALEEAFLEPMRMTQQEFTDFVKAEAATMEKVVRATGMQAE